MEFSPYWEKKLDTGYEWGKEAFLMFTRTGGLLSLVQPTKMGDSTTNLFAQKQLGILPPVTQSVSRPAPSLIRNYGVLVREFLSQCKRISNDFRNIGIKSISLSKLIDKLTDIVDKDYNAKLREGVPLVGTRVDAVIRLNDKEILSSKRNMKRFVGDVVTKDILSFNNEDDPIIVFGFVNATRLVKRVYPITNRRKRTMESVNKDNIVELSGVPFAKWIDWRINYAALNRIFRSNTTTTTNAAGLNFIMEEVADAVMVPLTGVQTVLAIECGWPTREVYRNTMPRDDGSKLYRGVTQAARPFWADVRSQFAKNGIAVPSKPEDATLAMQIAAPFVYLDKYKNSSIANVSLKSWPLTPALVYAFHQQSRGGQKVTFNPAKAAGSQSGVSKLVLAVAHKQYGKAGKVLSL